MGGGTVVGGGAGRSGRRPLSGRHSSSEALVEQPLPQSFPFCVGRLALEFSAVSCTETSPSLLSRGRSCHRALPLWMRGQERCVDVQLDRLRLGAGAVSGNAMPARDSTSAAAV